MELTPNDIRNFEFANALRGYDKDAVDTFKEQTARALETTKQEIVKLNMELESLRIQIAALKQFEDTIKSAAIDARRSADMLVASARKEAEQITAAAKGEAEKLLATRSDRVHDIEQRLQNLELIKKSYLTKVKGMIESHLELINEVASDDSSPIPAAPKPRLRREDNIDITESTEVRRAQRETIATQPSKADAPILEEANAVGQIITATPLPENDMAALQRTLRDPEGRSLDPELAQALDNYNKAAQSQGMGDHGPHVKDTQPIPITSNALGRVTTFQEDRKADEAESINLGETDSEAKTEHNTINIDQPIALDPVAEKLSRELDEVAAKFAEEMDKASKG